MNTHVHIVSYAGIGEAFLAQIQRWSKEVLDRTERGPPPSYLSVNIWRSTEELNAFYQREKEALGVTTGEESEFLATHEAWRGYPRIHICHERLGDIPVAVLQGVLHHEITHALLHGGVEFYTFRFSIRLQEAGKSCGLDLPLLQHCVYLLSTVIKDLDVVQRLAEIGLGFSQRALFEYLISDTEEEHRAWEIAHPCPALRKLALAALLKVPLPIEGMASVGLPEAPALKEQWHQTYSWLSRSIREGLFRFARRALEYDKEPFQGRLEQAALDLITDPFL